MSTRSAIARKTSTGFLGVYHRLDGYPSGVGSTLFSLYHKRFGRDLPRMLHFLIDEHPAGWRSINNCDFDLGGPAGPQCYCHGAIREAATSLDENNSFGLEWAYVFDEPKKLMGIYSRDYGYDTPKWSLVASIALDGREPNWEQLNRGVPDTDQTATDADTALGETTYAN